MAKYKYNGYPLPGIPDTVTEEFAHKVIVYYNDTFFLFCANAEFSVQQIDGADTIAFPELSSCYLFGCEEDSAEWRGGLFESGDGITTVSGWYIIPTYATFIWCNPDICDADGAVVYAASAPVPVFVLQSFLNFLAAGLVCKGSLAPAQKEPVAYLYNGVRLPKLPEWDKTVYPYASIVLIGNIYACYAMDTAEYSKNDGYVYLPNGANLREYRLIDGEWVLKNEFVWDVEEHGEVLSDYVWASYDILNTDGTICFVASEPVPVYE